MDEVTELHVGEKQAKLLMELYGLRSNGESINYLPPQKQDSDIS